MMYRHWTLCVLFSLVLVALSAIFAGLGYNTATAICAIIASASVIYYGFVFRTAYKALTAKRAELERKMHAFERAALGMERSRREYSELVLKMRSNQKTEFVRPSLN